MSYHLRHLGHCLVVDNAATVAKIVTAGFVPSRWHKPALQYSLTLSTRNESVKHSAQPFWKIDYKHRIIALLADVSFRLV